MTEYEKYVDGLAILIEKCIKLKNIIPTFYYKTMININKINKNILINQILEKPEHITIDEKFIYDKIKQNEYKLFKVRFHISPNIPNIIYCDKETCEKFYSHREIAELLYHLDKDLSEELYEYLEELIITNS